MNWIKNHYPWVFSGAGVAVIIALLNWFSAAPARKHSAPSQIQSGTGNVQVNGDVFISGKIDRQLTDRITYPKSEVTDSTSLITINPDKSWTVIVPPTETGVSLRSNSGDEFIINSGDKIEILVSGYVNIGRGSFGPNG